MPSSVSSTPLRPPELLVGERVRPRRAVDGLRGPRAPARPLPAPVAHARRPREQAAQPVRPLGGEPLALHAPGPQVHPVPPDLARHRGRRPSEPARDLAHALAPVQAALDAPPVVEREPRVGAPRGERGGLRPLRAPHLPASLPGPPTGPTPQGFQNPAQRVALGSGILGTRCTEVETSGKANISS